jgi:hypothetical protein
MLEKLPAAVVLELIGERIEIACKTAMFARRTNDARG